MKGTGKGTGYVPGLGLPMLIPGPFAGAGWTVLECQAADASVNIPGKRANLPRVMLAEDVGVHVHELRHVARAKLWHAAHLVEEMLAPDLRGAFARMLEECALESDAVSIGLDMVLQARNHLDWENIPPATSREQRALWCLQLWMTRDRALNKAVGTSFMDAWKWLDHADRRIVEQCANGVAANPNDVAGIMRYAAMLAGHFAPPPDPPKQGESRQAKQARAEAEAEAAEAEQAREDARKQANSSPVADESGMGEHATGDGGHGAVDIHRHTTTTSTARTVRSGWRSTSNGSALRYPRNLIPGGRVYGVRKRDGCIIIDASTSMNWTTDDLVRAVRDIPGVRVVAYASHNTQPSVYRARACIVADRGRVGDAAEVLREPEQSGTNHGTGADAAVLALAGAKWAKPAVWVSDGEVSYACNAEVDALLKRYRIPRVLTVADAVKYLQGKSVYGYRVCYPGRTPAERIQHNG